MGLLVTPLLAVLPAGRADAVPAYAPQTTITTAGSVQSYTIPSGVTKVHIQAWGAKGGDNTYSSAKSGGLGAKVSAAFDVSSVSGLDVTLGGVGQNSESSPNVNPLNPGTPGGAGGYHGGGPSTRSNLSTYLPGGGGGGWTGVATSGGSPVTLIYAGGGGGATWTGNGGAGGQNGVAGTWTLGGGYDLGGKAATQSAVGGESVWSASPVDATYVSGGAGSGNNGGEAFSGPPAPSNDYCRYGGGGGGGGYFGGGAGACQNSQGSGGGGGGGSSKFDASALAGTTSYASAQNASNNGNGKVIITPYPNAPATPTAVAGNASATVSFDAPQTGIQPTGYSVEYVYGAGVVYSAVTGCTSIATTTCTGTGLTNGQSTRFRVKALFSGGGASIVSDVSSSSAAVIIGTTTPPTALAGTSGNGQVALTWTAPASTGASAVTSYTVQKSTDGVSYSNATGCVAVASASCTATGLTNGTAYTFKVAATNGSGLGAYSDASASITVGTPAAPSGVSGTAADGQVALTWTTPANNGDAITAYTVQQSTDGTSYSNATGCVAVASASCTATGLSNGTSYTFKASATNARGAGPYSVASSAVLVGAPPSAPTGVTGTAGDSQVALMWSAPANVYGSAVTAYSVQKSENGGAYSNATGCVAVATVSCTATGLTNGSTYTFKTSATNALGPSSYSTPSSAILVGLPPSAPTSVAGVPGELEVALTWMAPANVYGSAVTSYTAQQSSDGVTYTDATGCVGVVLTTCTVTGLDGGTPYTFKVSATNVHGVGAYSTASTAVTPTSPPLPPSGGGGGGSSETTGVDAGPVLPPDLSAQALREQPGDGQAVVNIGGAPVAATVRANATNTGLDVVGAGWSVAISGLTNTGALIPLGPNGTLTVTPGDTVSTSGVGFADASPLRTYMMSTPLLLGSSTATASGAFSSSVVIPVQAALGDHILQINGVDPSGKVRSISIAMELVSAALPVRDAGSVVYFGYGSTKLTNVAKKSLWALAHQTPQDVGVRATISGVVRQTGATAADRTLAMARARVVQIYLNRIGSYTSSTVGIRKQALRNLPQSRRVLVWLRWG